MASALLCLYVFRPLDGYLGELASLAFREDTVFAPGYSAFKFWRIRRGMTEAEVERLVGGPLKTWTPRDVDLDEVYWSYSHSPGDTHYRMRLVCFRDGRVHDLHTEFYVD
ncbi:hypothetical protein OWM54_29830 [Myxococcus sp. MISCRS1]|uniref:hypothetical protein n=1 Tax=Myxococcus TaxID=32 RepID=UPI001CBB2831|nr:MULTISPECIES: hypothetical protein [unclassified Myxococcus]MBZ4410483.1 hypothetical protein [Myxococcus sp. XM-1-1-1]MCY1001358.1 hypothetical protein [Myxococcus sp. MISCRS1]